jgi:hypothetical protein
MFVHIKLLHNILWSMHFVNMAVILCRLKPFNWNHFWKQERQFLITNLMIHIHIVVNTWKKTMFCQKFWLCSSHDLKSSIGILILWLYISTIHYITCVWWLSMKWNYYYTCIYINWFSIEGQPSHGMEKLQENSIIWHWHINSIKRLGQAPLTSSSVLLIVELMILKYTWAHALITELRHTDQAFLTLSTV